MSFATPRLKALAAGRKKAPTPPALVTERALDGGAAVEGAQCELCAAPIAERHRHLVDLEDRALRCVCRACAILFDRREAGGSHYRLVPDRVLLLEGFRPPDELWSAFGIPVEIAFFFHDSRAGRVVAFYPGPMGATESTLGLERWPELVASHAALSDVEPDVEAVLVDRVTDGGSVWIVPVDVCYRLVGVMRQSWKGLAGGPEVRHRVRTFYEDLSGRAEVVA